MLEPRDGDFVAYIDALQRESAARLARQHVNIADPAFPHGVAASGHDGSSLPHPAASPTGTAPASAVRRARAPDAKVFRALVAAAVGAVSFLSWLRGSGTFALILGAALLVYAAPRLRAAYRERARAPTPDAAAAIDHVFGRSGTPTTGTKP